jgi:hemolysin D
VKRRADHHDFKPILSEIEDRPPNPLGTAFLWTIVALVAIVSLGLYLVKVDVVVAARGKVVPLGDVKVVQPLETGVVTGIHVREGDFVRKGAVLMEIDPTVDRADLEGREKNLRSSELALGRIRAVLSGRSFSPTGGDVAPEALRMQAEQHRAQRLVYASTLREKKKAFREARRELQSLQDEIGNLDGIRDLVRADERRHRELVEIGALAEFRLREKVRERLALERERDVKVGQAEQAAIRLERIVNEADTFQGSFRERLLAEYATNLQARNSLAAEVESLRFRQEKRFILSPVDGYVHLLPVKTIGGVVTTAQPVASLVPEKSPLVVQAAVLNRDIGLLREGQRCVIKVDAFDFQKYGTADGQVEAINPFSLEESRNGEKTEGGNAQGAEAGNYPVRVKMLTAELRARDGALHRIRPGMSVTVEINVGRRRVIEFFLFPVLRYLDEGLKVR